MTVLIWKALLKSPAQSKSIALQPVLGVLVLLVLPLSRSKQIGSAAGLAACGSSLFLVSFLWFRSSCACAGIDGAPAQVSHPCASVSTCAFMGTGGGASIV